MRKEGFKKPEPQAEENVNEDGFVAFSKDSLYKLLPVEEKGKRYLCINA